VLLDIGGHGRTCWAKEKENENENLFAARCSLVISAVCHATPDNSESHLRLLKWGVVDSSMYDGEMYDGEMHCSLLSRHVTKPKSGNKYMRYPNMSNGAKIALRSS
jgi:hypothetical protein